MSKKYHIHVETMPPRFSPISKYASFETSRCLGCRRCVKYTACVYNVHQKRTFDPTELQETGDNMCVGCFRCVQECKSNIMNRGVNPRFARLGNQYWTPDIIARIWKQAETGKIPVSGAGYRGPFAGPGFDRMWTDMSEIVRPTRDGIHGREYISAMIEMGRKLDHLTFDETGALVSGPPPLKEIMIPAVLDIPPLFHLKASGRRAMVKAARDLQTLAVATYEEAAGALKEFLGLLIVQVDPDRDDLSKISGAPIVEIIHSEKINGQVEAARKALPGVIVSVRLALDEQAAERSVELARQTADILHLQASPDGDGLGAKEEVFVIDLMRQVHMKLVEEMLRDQVTILATGGIAMAEHMAKLVICGADGVGVDLAAAAALECRLCNDCEEQAECPVDIDNVNEDWGAQRIVNLIGAWHSQLIEVMGAMGMREVRRLRGEVGRAMFFEDLERDNFSPLFGRRESVVLSSGNPGVDALRTPDPDVFTPEPPQIDMSQYKPGLVRECGSRYRNALTKHRVALTTSCDNCGKCVETCRFGVLRSSGGPLHAPRTEDCRGPEVCKSLGAYCGDVCPKNAITVAANPLWETMGDPRWTADLLASTWIQAETGEPPKGRGLEYKVGASGGGFDRIDFTFPEDPPDPALKPGDVNLAIDLNRRGDCNRPKITIGFPVYGGGMSFGSISLATMLGRARAYTAFDSFTCTGEGGYPDELTFYDDHVITQVATGLFGVREETIQRVRIVEFKYAQGAKPGLGGHLLGDKVTPAVARMREAVEGNSLFSPFPFHSVYSVEDHKKHVDWIKMINPRTLVSVKVSTPNDVDMVAVGSYYAGAHIIHIDGSYGGTGAAPDIAKKNIAMPIEYAIPKVHAFLKAEGVREQMTLIASGGIRTAYDIAKAIALGADGVVIGTAEMVALECVRCGNCESGRGCPRGIATTDPELSQTYDTAWASQRIVNLFHSFAVQLQEILHRLGMKDVKELVGRSDLLTHRDYLARTA